MFVYVCVFGAGCLRLQAQVGVCVCAVYVCGCKFQIIRVKMLVDTFRNHSLLSYMLLNKKIGGRDRDIKRGRE